MTRAGRIHIRRTMVTRSMRRIRSENVKFNLGVIDCIKPEYSRAYCR